MCWTVWIVSKWLDLVATHFFSGFLEKHKHRNNLYSQCELCKKSKSHTHKRLVGFFAHLFFILMRFSIWNVKWRTIKKRPYREKHGTRKESVRASSCSTKQMFSYSMLSRKEKEKKAENEKVKRKTYTHLKSHFNGAYKI